MRCCSFSRAEKTTPITVADKLVTLESRFAPFHLSIKFPAEGHAVQGRVVTLTAAPRFQRTTRHPPGIRVS